MVIPCSSHRWLHAMSHSQLKCYRFDVLTDVFNFRPPGRLPSSLTPPEKSTLMVQYVQKIFVVNFTL